MTNSNSVPSNIQARGIGIRLGNDEHNRPQQPCAGSLDDFRIYNRALTAPDILALTGIGVAAPSLSVASLQ